MNQIVTDQEYKKVIEKIQQLSESTNSYLGSPNEVNHLRQLAINYEYKRYDLTLVKVDQIQLPATG